MNNIAKISKEQTEVSARISQQDHYMQMMDFAIKSENGLEKMGQLMVLQERFEANQARKDFNLAMSKFQSLLPVIEKTGKVDYTSSKGRTFYDYAKLEDIAKSIRPALSETGLSYRHTQSQTNNIITVTCIVTHSSGHSEISALSSTPDISGGKDQLKAIASAISYLRRYTLTGILGIVVGGEDDESFGGEPVVENKTQDAPIPDAEFEKNFPTWADKITSGKKTAAQMVDYLNKKGVLFNQDQINKIYGLEAK